MQEKKKFNFWTIIKAFIFVYSILLVVIAMQTRFSQDSGKGFFGFNIYSIVTGSMEPVYSVGDVILVHRVPVNDIKIGDVIAYKGMENDFKDKIITHRVESIIHEGDRPTFYTKGIASNTMDPAVYDKQVYGKVIHKFFILSLIRKIINNFFGFLLVVLLPLIVIFISEFKELKRLKLISDRAKRIKEIRMNKDKR